MNTQIRRLFTVILTMFALLAVAATNIQFVQAPSLNADGRNSRTYLQAQESDRGPIIVAGETVAQSTQIEGTQRYQRSYSQGSLYASVTGYFSPYATSTGIESAMDSVLTGDSTVLLEQRIRNLLTGESRQGGGVVLTIDPELQQIAAEQLGDRKGAVVVLDADTGAILALYSSPSYDPNDLASQSTEEVNAAFQELEADPDRPLTNRAIAGDRYAPGSTFKILTTIALLEEGVATPDTLMESPTTITLPGTETTLSNIEEAECGDGNPSLTEAFARSCNTTFALASQDIDEETLADVAERFGFGDSLSIPLEVTPSVFPSDLSDAELALSAIGQYEVATTPLQMAMVVQAIANDGTMMQPYLVDSIVNADLEEQSSTSPEVLSEPISSEIADQLTEMMVEVVSASYGTGQSMQIEGVEVAAKTGTAEVGDTGYANAWAVGFAPADDPEIVFAVVVEGDESDPVPHGGEDAGPIARALLEAGLDQ